MNYTTCEKAQLKAGHHRSSVSHERSHVLRDSISGQSTWSSLITTSDDISHDQCFVFLALPASGESKSYAPPFNMGTISVRLTQSGTRGTFRLIVFYPDQKAHNSSCRQLKHRAETVIVADIWLAVNVINSRGLHLKDVIGPFQSIQHFNLLLFIRSFSLLKLYNCYNKIVIIVH